MKSVNNVIQAIKDNQPVTELEMKCCIAAINSWRAMLYFDLARALVEGKKREPLSDKTMRGLQRAWDNQHKQFDVPLDRLIMGSSFEPGISNEERDKRRNDSMFKALTALQKFARKIDD